MAQATTSQMSGLQLNKDQPIQIESDKLEIKDQERIADFTGNVKVVQGTTTLQAGQMRVFYKAKDAATDGSAPATKAAESATPASGLSSSSADIDRILVSNKVFLTSGTQTATADNGSFDMAKQLFVLKGDKVVLTDGGNVFTGCQLTVQMATGQAQLESCGGRVQIQLDPQSQKKN
ncbi:lipopolysaccharide export system protein LptA [Rhizobium metallidurans]|uniref:Lipopolysaccharide export system protein LptA n=2 Tax=Rhizobium/Agrobacterium group TaxID=227290 RepID=A0A7W6CR36_9HYPH|nr:lipopolysaccharide export system protein LptA [Rhizobium metallidurans]